MAAPRAHTHALDALLFCIASVCLAVTLPLIVSMDNSSTAQGSCRVRLPRSCHMAHPQAASCYVVGLGQP